MSASGLEGVDLPLGPGGFGGPADDGYPLVFASQPGEGPGSTFSTASTASAPTLTTGANWMSAIADDRFIGDFTIPGTHETMSLFDHPVLSDTAKCQTMTLAEQLAAGARLLDIRCRHVGNAFTIHHGMVFQQANFDDVLTTVAAFLRQNPSETVLLSVKQEYEPLNPQGTFSDVFLDYVSRYQDAGPNGSPLFYPLGGADGFSASPNSMPKLGTLGAPESCRGKIVLVNRFDPAVGGIVATGFPVNGSGTVDTGNGFSLIVQDAYKLEDMSESSKQAKLVAFEQARLAATNSVPGSAFTMNFASGYSDLIFGIPDGIAELSQFMNPQIILQLRGDAQARPSAVQRSGGILVDYATPQLFEEIWRTATGPGRAILSRASVRPDITVGSEVGVLTTSVSSASATARYELVAGPGDTGNTAFEIVGNRLKTTSSLMGFVGSTLQVRVRATDSSGIATETVLAIQVTEGLVRVGLVGNWVRLTLAPEGTAITNLATTYDAPAARLTITAATAGSLAMAAPIDGITVDTVADTITVDLKKITKFAGLSIVGGANTDSVTIGSGGVNLAAIGRGAAAQGFFIDTGAGADDSIAIAGQIVAKGAGAVSLATKGTGVTHGILLASGVVTARGSQSFGGGVTLLNGVALQAGGDISFSSTIDGFGRLQLSAGRSITMAGDVGGWLPLQGITLAKAGRVSVGGGLVLDGSGTAAGTSGFVIGANVHDVVLSPQAAARTISGFDGAGIRFAGGSKGSRIAGVTSTGNGMGLLVGPGVYRGTVISGSDFSGNVGHGVSLQAARGLTIGGRAPGAGNEIVSNGGFGVAATGRCTGSLVVGSEIGANAIGQVENFLASTLSGNLLTQNATKLSLQLNDVGRAAYRAQKAKSYSFDVGVEAFVVSARSTGWLDTRTAALDIDATVGFMVPPPGAITPAGMQRTMLGQNRLATSLTPVQTLPGLEFAKSVEYVDSDAYGRHYRAVVGLSTFAGMIPLADLQAAPSIGRDGSPVPVDVWVNAQGNVSRIAGAFEGGRFTMSLRGQGASGFVPALAPTVAPGVSLAAAAVPEAVTSLSSHEPLLPGSPNGVSGARTGSSTLAIPFGAGAEAPADWYFPTQVDGTVEPQGVIWLQPASGATGSVLAALAVDLARQTNSIVVVPTLPTEMSWPLAGEAARRAVASLFEGGRAALVASAVAAGFVGDAAALTGRFVLAGHSAGGGFMTAVAADYAAQNPASTDLVGVIMEDGVSRGAFDGTGSFATQVAALDARSIPVYQLAAPAQLWNAYGATTSALLATNPGRFRGVVFTGGSHVDAMMGGDPATDIVAQRVTTPSLPGTAAAARLLTAGWINDLYAGAAPTDAQYGFYAAANAPILSGAAAATALPSPVASTWSAQEWRLNTELAALGGPSGFEPGPAVDAGDNGLSGAVTPPQSNGVTGVKTGTSSLAIPTSPRGFVTSADWYFPTQADGRVSANGLVWLQQGELRDAAAFAALATRIAGQTNSIVVAPAISSFEIPTQPGCFLGGAAMQQAVAGMMLGNRGSLAVSANAAGYQGVLPEKFVLAGQRLGGGFAVEVAAYTVDNGAAANLLGVVMVDGVAAPDRFAPALAKIDSLNVPFYQIAAPPQAANDWGNTTEQYALLHPDQFIGVQLDDGGDPDAMVTFATGWINDFYSGLYGPQDPYYGIYGNPNDGDYVPNQPIVLGNAGATVLPAPPEVDVNQYAGTWYEQGSVKQEPWSGLVNVTAVYTPQPDDTIGVEYSGTYGPTGPALDLTGSAVPINAPTNTRLSVNFFGPPTTAEPGNYWILDYAPDYSWSIVSDPTMTSGTILTRDQVVSADEYDALVARAYQLGVKGTITPTPQYPAP